MRSSEVNNPGWAKPEGSACSHSAAVARYIRERIEDAGGVLPFDQYMDAVLYAPGLGYYATGTRKFGEGGDLMRQPCRTDWAKRRGNRAAAMQFDLLMASKLLAQRVDPLPAKVCPEPRRHRGSWQA